MRFMTLVKSAEKLRSGPPPKELIEAIGKLSEEATRTGEMVGMGGLMPRTPGARVVLSGSDKVPVIDGPLTVAKERIGGATILRVTSTLEALARWAACP